MTMPPGLHNAPAVGHFMRFGAQLRPGGGVDFNLWAPKARTAEVVLGRGVEGEELDRVAAISEPGGWWRVHVADASADTRYQWQIDGALRVPDPAAREAPEGPHGLCKVSQPGGYAWHRADWRGRPWQEMVFYELHVGTFTLAGTYAAAAAELPRLAALGFTAIELMPLATFGGQWGWGYDGVLPFAPHPAYGKPDDLKHFVDAAHALGLCVFLDVVYNHFGPDGNYLHAYAPAFFSATNDSPWGPAINFDAEGSDTVREFFVHNALYWIEEFRMDGLRLDAVHAIVDDGRPHILQAISESVRGLARSTGRHVHLVLENEKNQAGWLVAPEGLGAGYDAQWNDDFHHALHVALTGESHTYYAQFARDPMALLARVLTHGFAFPHGRLATHEDPPLALTAMVHSWATTTRLETARLAKGCRHWCQSRPPNWHCCWSCSRQRSPWSSWATNSGHPRRSIISPIGRATCGTRYGQGGRTSSAMRPPKRARSPTPAMPPPGLRVASAGKNRSCPQGGHAALCCSARSKSAANGSRRTPNTWPTAGTPPSAWALAGCAWCGPTGTGCGGAWRPTWGLSHCQQRRPPLPGRPCWHTAGQPKHPAPRPPGLPGPPAGPA